ncbi:hypothetical protein X953_19085 [Virgibacillus sp. SK37]|nr:hypothetical protein X953_19085 [Virgibacillus sp. SK37]
MYNWVAEITLKLYNKVNYQKTQKGRDAIAN